MNSDTRGSTPPEDPLLPPDWETLSPLLDQILDAPPDQRAALIDRLCRGDAARQRALTDLLAASELAAPLLEGSAPERFPDLAQDEERSLLPELVGDRYRTGRELGRGGMARVYLAHDLKHGRDVAIKVIRPEIAASLGHDRFLREIEIAARLRHPNIVPLYDSGEIGGALYFVMPYEEGTSLRDRLTNEGALPIADALGVLRDVARALAYAHEHGVVHRDVKPDNVILSGGAAVVTDFGIAKAVSLALSTYSTPTLTQVGAGIGTPAYMAPEQATGDPSTDHRADIYSFGCLAYELFAGQPPFAGDSIHLVIADQISTPAPSITATRPDVPPGIADLIARCLEKDPAARPQTARELLTALDAGATTGGSVPSRVPGPRRPGARRWLGGAAVVTLLVLGAGYLTLRPAHTTPLTMAVLPFGNIGNDSTVSFVADGLADEVAMILARVPGIQIKSRSGARFYRGQLGVDPTEAGTRLQADYILTAVVRKDGQRWILSAELSRAADKASLWAADFQLSADEQAAAAETIASGLVDTLRTLFPRSVGATPVLAANQRTTNNEAYRLYLRGQEKLSRRGQSVKESADLFRASIAQDSLFAPAWSGLSMALVLFPYFQRVPTSAIYAEATHAAKRALALDPTLALPHVAQGTAYMLDYQWDSARTEFELAVQLDPHSVEARVQYARYLIFRGSLEESLAQLRVARAEDPASALVLSWISDAYFLGGQIDSAMAESRRALETDSTNYSTLNIGALIRLAADRSVETERLVSLMPKASPMSGYCLARLGHTKEALASLRALDAARPQSAIAETERAFTYLGLGDTAQALSALERATDRREIWLALYGPKDPIYRSVWKSPRFEALLRRVGLTG